MRNILYIDVMNDCECSLVSRVNDGSNLLVLNIHVDVSKNPQLEINSKNIPLSVTDCVYVVPPALYVGTDSLQFRIIDNDHIGNYFSIIKVQSINGNLYIAQKSNFEYEFRTAKDNSFSFKIGDVTTLPAGEKPSVSNSGSDQHIVLDFAIPSGAAGATGAKGDKGETGAAGADALTLVITSSGGMIFKNTAIATTLTAHVYKGAVEVTGSALSALGTIKWYKDGETTAVATGQTLTISSGNVANKASYTAQLEA